VGLLGAHLGEGQRRHDRVEAALLKAVLDLRRAELDPLDLSARLPGHTLGAGHRQHLGVAIQPDDARPQGGAGEGEPAGAAADVQQPPARPGHPLGDPSPQGLDVTIAQPPDATVIPPRRRLENLHVNEGAHPRNILPPEGGDRPQGSGSADLRPGAGAGAR